MKLHNKQFTRIGQVIHMRDKISHHLIQPPYTTGIQSRPETYKTGSMFRKLVWFISIGGSGFGLQS